jgi:predicted TIM-barrel fold metal-dependent hydrolase
MPQTQKIPAVNSKRLNCYGVLRKGIGPARPGSDMGSIPLHYVWQYTDIDRAFWEEHLEDWVPRRIIDAHTHVIDPRLRREPMTPEMRRQYWVSEVLEPIDAPSAERCHKIVYPGREVRCVAFGHPDLDFDIEAGNRYVQEECQKRGWYSLAVVRPQWSADQLAAELARPGVLGTKPYYALISHNRLTRDEHLEAGIFDFLPHHLLEVLDDRHAWVTLHVPKASRLGHPDNLRQIREIRRRYPNVVLVLAHLGRCYTEAHALEGIVPLADDPGLYFDTSAVLNPASHRVALEHLGPERLLYGTDNPVFYMRGRRQYSGKTYVNRTNYDFHFNRERESPEIEARYTLYLYEDLLAIKQACTDLGLTDRKTIEALFHDNAARLIQSVLAGHE